MPKVTIDGREIDVAAGTTILQAALAEGREIPHYCYHAGLSIAGNCRMCLVEVEKAPKLVIGCYTPVADGMVVRTGSEKVKQAQSAMMEFFLINHPLDCPICDEAGECRLQDYAVEHGTGRSRYTEPKLALQKAVDIGKHVMLDQERCIQCSRCIRFCDEVSKTHELGFFGRGERTVIGTFPGKPLDNLYSGNVVDICPVGALTLKEFRFQTRVWYLKNTPTICAGCARGCNVVVGVGTQQILMTTAGQQDDRIKRLVPRVNEEVNGHWMCDEGRLSYQRLQRGERLLTAESPRGTRVEWDGAVAQVAASLTSAGRAGRAAAILSPRLLSEDLLAWRLLFEKLGLTKIAVRCLVRGEDDALLLRADRGANSTGARWILGEGVSEASILEGVSRGEVDVLLVVGDPLDPADDPPAPGGKARILFVGPLVSSVASSASVLLPTSAWSEEEGTVVNFQGRIQRMRRCHAPRGEGRPGWKAAAEIAAAAGESLPAWTAWEDVFRSLAESIEDYRGRTPEEVGLLGAPGGQAERVEAR
jgi:NADH-quinone oxidoreductase subunit G